MVSTPGRLHVDGYRPSNYSCPKRRNTKECDNQTINDSVLGEFVVNYILNMLNAKKEFSGIKSPEELEKRLLFGSTFSSVERIEENGLHEFFNLLARYGSDSSYSFSIRKPRKKKAAVAPEVEQLRKEKERQERAMQRLQELYL
ncbi:MAG: recombinase family protein, partial [Lachnospiraceae bacterium]|nr:recombinase family protein [Lachnospiraceae bacterium]